MDFKKLENLLHQEIDFVLDEAKEKIQEVETKEKKQETLEITSHIEKQLSPDCRKVALPELSYNFPQVKVFGKYVEEIKNWSNYGIIKFTLNDEFKEVEIKTDYGNLSNDDLINLGLLSLLNSRKVKIAIIKDYEELKGYERQRRYKVIELVLY